MSLEIVLGPMFAGKSSYILSHIRRHKSIGYKIFIITHSFDTRYSNNAICSHDKDKENAVATDTLINFINNPEFQVAKLIIIEEAQFFSDLYDFVSQAVDIYKKDVICVGLDGDSERKPFGDILKLIPLCDNVKKLTAMCSNCSDGTAAIFTYRIVENKETISVGGKDQYKPLCRKCYLYEKNIEKKNR